MPKTLPTVGSPRWRIPPAPSSGCGRPPRRQPADGNEGRTRRMRDQTMDAAGRRPSQAKPTSPGIASRDAIRTEGLVRHFDDVRAVDGVDLQIPAGEIYGFLGANGAGKSTTVHMLCTLLAPSGGRAIVAGYDVATQPGQVRLRIGVALQEAALDPKQTGSELLQLQGRLYGLTRREVAQRVSELATL